MALFFFCNDSKIAIYALEILACFFFSFSLLFEYITQQVFFSG